MGYMVIEMQELKIGCTALKDSGSAESKVNKMASYVRLKKSAKKVDGMKASDEILEVWKRFDGFPMETLTKAWFFKRAGDQKQRSVELMKQQRQQYNITGNCFDLALWLLDEFRKEGIKAYPIGSELGTEEAHAAVVAEDKRGRRYLCDLGDQWLQPVLLDADDPEFSEERIAGFFPGAEVQVSAANGKAEIVYHRPGGKESRQTYELAPVDDSLFWQAAEFSQNHVYRKPLLEVRVPYKEEKAHWEFDDWKSFLSTSEGLFPDPPAANLAEWVERIHGRTGYDKEFLLEALEIYKAMGER